MKKSLFHIIYPIFLFFTTLTYTLGVGVAHYLGRVVNPASFWLGLLTVLTLISSSFLLAEYFTLPLMPFQPDETQWVREHFRVTLLQVSFAGLTLATVAIIIMMVTRLLNLPAGILLILMFILLVAYSIPPMKLSEKGYGELVLALVLGSIFPGFGFLLQDSLFHRLLSFTTFPLTLLALIYLLICNFPTFASDLKSGHQTLLTRLTWQRAIPIHHFLVLSVFFLYAVSPFLGVPWRLIGPVFLALPFAIIQIIWLQRIANGGRTLWRLLIAFASATFGLTAYFLALTYWIH
jgi:1,4-dihydroxy-2-naphthoate octaprenyltransferase